jgi:hypothetical protein
MTAMKLSISIPDDLWLAVRRTDEPNSRVVQEALRLLADQRAATAENPLPGAVGTEYDPSNTEHWQEVQAGLDRLHAEASRLHTLGYQVGVDTARQAPWNELERLPADRTALARKLADMHVESDFETEGEVFYFMDQSIKTWDVDKILKDDQDEYADSPTFFAGVAQAIDEARSAVRARLNRTLAGSRSLDEQGR